MAIEHGLPSEGAPSSISINLGQSKKKEAHVCIFDGCTRGKRGYSDYCRKHKAIGKIVTEKIVRETEKIAREKAINVDSSISMYEESLRIQESELLPIQKSVHLKSPHHCKFDDCQNQRKGYSDFCREHKAIGKIIAGKIAREKAIAKIAERDNQGQVTETNPTDYSANMDHNLGKELRQDNSSLFLFGFSFLLLIFFLTTGPKSGEMAAIACFGLPMLCAIIGTAIKEPMTRLLVMIFLIPITVYLTFVFFLAMLFADLGSGGCYGVCGLSGWGGP